ncbi:hypothetical protein F4678DRAFT_59079 [Xylaria arbuscula]|nr:hypothetical protein F4678DRAFT_59079 [Xylaria arbuscula]
MVYGFCISMVAFSVLFLLSVGTNTTNLEVLGVLRFTWSDCQACIRQESEFVTICIRGPLSVPSRSSHQHDALQHQRASPHSMFFFVCLCVKLAWLYYRTLGNDTPPLEPPLCERGVNQIVRNCRHTHWCLGQGISINNIIFHALIMILAQVPSCIVF